MFVPSAQEQVVSAPVEEPAVSLVTEDGLLRALVAGPGIDIAVSADGDTVEISNAGLVSLNPSPGGAVSFVNNSDPQNPQILGLGVTGDLLLAEAVPGFVTITPTSLDGGTVTSVEPAGATGSAMVIPPYTTTPTIANVAAGTNLALTATASTFSFATTGLVQNVTSSGDGGDSAIDLVTGTAANPQLLSLTGGSNITITSAAGVATIASPDTAGTPPLIQITTASQFLNYSVAAVPSQPSPNIPASAFINILGNSNWGVSSNTSMAFDIATGYITSTVPGDFKIVFSVTVLGQGANLPLTLYVAPIYMLGGIPTRVDTLNASYTQTTANAGFRGTISYSGVVSLPAAPTNLYLGMAMVGNGGVPISPIIQDGLVYLRAINE